MFTVHYNPTFDVLEVAYHAARQNQMPRRWLNALTIAYDRLLEMDGATLELDEAGNAIGAHIPSATDDTVYHANGACQCQASAHGNPCWHRAAARLLQRCWEAEGAALESTYDKAMREINELFPN